MRTLSIASLAAGALLLTGATPPPVDIDAVGARNRAALAGRVPGEPVDCISARQLRGNSGIAPGVIRFDGIGGRIYVNETNGCNLRPGLALVNYRSTARLCRGQIVQVVDPNTGAGHGSCTLGVFTPYERAR